MRHLILHILCDETKIIITCAFIQSIGVLVLPGIPYLTGLRGVYGHEARASRHFLPRVVAGR